jgi:hypothetical protein
MVMKGETKKNTRKNKHIKDIKVAGEKVTNERMQAKNNTNFDGG